jgi:alpha-glucosidase
MKLTVYFIFLFIFVLTISISSAEETTDLFSPNKNIQVKIELSNKISYSVLFKDQVILSHSSLSLMIKEGDRLGLNPKLKNEKKRSVSEKIYPVVPEKRKIIPDVFNEINLEFEGNYGLIFRAYDDGVAYRFYTKINGEITIVNEEVAFNLPNDRSSYFPFEESFLTHSERQYPYVKISEITSEQMGCVPVLIYDDAKPILAFTEADLDDYPGIYLAGSADSSPSLFGKFPPVALEEEQTKDRTIEVSKGANYIAKTKGNRQFPWRVMMIAEQDKDLLVNDIVFRLGSPLQIKDTSWIKPGKVAWDWWNNWNLEGVDFRAGINTETYKYYIDFASKYNIEYIIMDEGWSDPSDLFKINPDINMEEILSYAKQKNVGIILWCIWVALDRQFDKAFDQFEKWGVKGIKVDFMQRDDQKIVNYYDRVTKEAAKRKLLVDFHGSYKPTGLRRAYPNLITREGVLGLEHSKWSKNVTPEHDCTLPFTRMLAGPMDFTPGAMINSTEKQFSIIYDKPMSQGTRCHQLALYVIFESPLQMLCDVPSNYQREPEAMEFLSKVPTVWDATNVLDAKVSEYILSARQSGKEWYIGAITNWKPRNFTIDFSFLETGNYTIEIYQDGINADRNAMDFKKVTKQITKSDKLEIKLAPGGGWAARIYIK